MDVENPLQLVCKICPPDKGEKFDRQAALMDHIKRDHLSEKIRPLMNSRPPYKCPFYTKCHYSSEVSVNEVINHVLDPTSSHGSVNYLKILLSNFIDDQQFSPTKQEVSGSNLVTSTQAESPGTHSGIYFFIIFRYISMRSLTILKYSKSHTSYQVTSTLLGSKYMEQNGRFLRKLLRVKIKNLKLDRNQK